MKPSFATRLIDWQRQHGRHHLPWQTQDPYRVWLSEIMLQQTQVATVLDYYPRFVAAFPDIAALAAAEQEAVLSLWAGLGYYSRARNLHKAARQVVEQFGGQFPSSRLQLESLCGVGRSTAAAIAAFAFHQRETILDGNVKRVLCRVFAADGNPADKAFERQLWTLAESLLPEQADDMPAYTQGLMDLGATVCKRSKPLCSACPMADLCQAKAQQLIDVLPRKKSAVAVQQQYWYWLALTDQQGAVWLEKRPQHGIWAGLYCLPTFDNLADLYAYATRFGISETELQESPAINHRLTHRLLEITPLSATVEHIENIENQECLSEKNGGWVKRQELADHGLPKPLSRYLAGLD